jgi:hypothetical protein
VTQIGGDHQKKKKIGGGVGWGGESLSENPPKPNPHRATNRPIRPLQKKEGGRRKRQGRGKNEKKQKGEGAVGKGKREDTKTRASDK